MPFLGCIATIDGLSPIYAYWILHYFELVNFWCIYDSWGSCPPQQSFLGVSSHPKWWTAKLMVLRIS